MGAWTDAPVTPPRILLGINVVLRFYIFSIDIIYFYFSPFIVIVFILEVITGQLGSLFS